MEDMPLALAITEYPGRDWMLENFNLEFRKAKRDEYVKVLEAYPVFKYLKSASPEVTELREAYLKVLSAR